MKSSFRLAALTVAAALTGMPVHANCRDEKPASPTQPPKAEILHSKGIQNFYRLTPKIFSGAQPEGDEGFQALHALGIRTLISVDGATPDVELARKYKLRYVHLPIGYDGIHSAQGLRLVKAAISLPGPVFVHCHHGMHRGPAAAAFCAVATGGWSREQATSWMKDAGTAATYRGLFHSVRLLPIPTERELNDASDEFPETAPVPALVEQMLEIDHDWDRLKAIREAGFKKVEGDDATPAEATLQLVERFRELGRSEAIHDKGRDFAAKVEEAERSARALEKAIGELGNTPGPKAREAAQSAFRKVAASCTTCHARFRDAVETE